MPRVCTVCAHSELEDIDRALVAGEESFRNIAERFSVSVGALHRHKSAHLPATLVKAQAAHEVARADDLLAQANELHRRARSILDDAEGAGDLRTALHAIREARATLELLARLMGELQDAASVNVVFSREWTEVRGVVVNALQSYPAARLAVVKALEGIGDAGR